MKENSRSYCLKTSAAAGLCGLALQNATSMMLQHKLQTWSDNDGVRYEPLTAIILSEALKLTISSACVAWGVLRAPSTSPTPSFWGLVLNGHHKSAIPAILYTLATASQSIGAYNLDILSFLMLSQAKIITTPIFSTILINQSFRPQQWLCLILMALGIAFVQVGSAPSSPDSSITVPHSHSTISGVASMLLAGFYIAFAGVYMETILKSSPDGFMVRNAQLAWYSCICATLGLVWQTKLDFKDFFVGYHESVWVLVVLQATGGFLVAWCVRMTSTVAKNYAQGLGFLTASTIPLFFSSRSINCQLSCGIVLVLGSVFGSFGSLRKTETKSQIADYLNEKKGDSMV